MAKRRHAVGRKQKTSSKKTKKRLEIKKLMLEKKAYDIKIIWFDAPINHKLIGSYGKCHLYLCTLGIDRIYQLILFDRTIWFSKQTKTKSIQNC